MTFEVKLTSSLNYKQNDILCIWCNTVQYSKVPEDPE